MEIKGKIESLRAEILETARRFGRNPDEIRLMAVSKYQDIEAVKEAYDAGVRYFGENRVQEASSKFDKIGVERGDFRLDMIGTLQRNKVNKALSIFNSIQSVDSLDLLAAILARVHTIRSPIGLYFELHTGEESKAGFPDREELLRACDFLSRSQKQGGEETSKEFEGRQSGTVRLLGLMTMAPLTEDETRVHKAFAALKTAFEDVKARFDFPDFVDLSMGMSGDYKIAIEEGSTMLRIGTAIFGDRTR